MALFAWAQPFNDMWNAHAQIQTDLQQIRKFLEVKTIRFIKNNKHKGKEL